MHIVKTDGQQLGRTTIFATQNLNSDTEEYVYQRIKAVCIHKRSASRLLCDHRILVK